MRLLWLSVNNSLGQPSWKLESDWGEKWREKTNKQVTKWLKFKFDDKSSFPNQFMQLDFPKKKLNLSDKSRIGEIAILGGGTRTRRFRRIVCVGVWQLGKKFREKGGKEKRKILEPERSEAKLWKVMLMREKEDGWLSYDFTNEILSQIYRVGS